MTNLTPLMDFDKLRTDALALIKSAGRKVELKLLRHVDATPTDPTKPWRVGTGTILTFPFLAPVSDVAFSRLGEPTFDGDKNILIPGDITTTAAVEDSNTLCGEPTHLDRIDLDGAQYQITGINAVNPYDVPIVFITRIKLWPSIMSVPPTPS